MSAAPTPNAHANHDSCAWVAVIEMAMSHTPDTSDSTTPNTMWWTCVAPALTLLNHHFTSARIRRTLTRVATKPPTKPAKNSSSGSLPPATMSWVYQWCTR